MSDTKLLQAIVDGQSSLKEELKNDIKKIVVEVEKVKVEVQKVKIEVRNNGKRIDKLGLAIARLEDDAPTVAEFDELETRVTKLENQSVAT